MPADSFWNSGCPIRTAKIPVRKVPRFVPGAYTYDRAGRLIEEEETQLRVPRSRTTTAIG